MKLQLFKQIPATHKQIDEVVQNTKELILSGNYNPLDLEIQLKSLEETIKRIRSDNDIKDYVAEEVNKEPDKSFRRGSVMITKGQRKTYDYSSDKQWLELKSQETEIAEFRKSREKQLTSKRLEDGEILLPLEPIKVSEFLIIKFDDGN